MFAKQDTDRFQTSTSVEHSQQLFYSLFPSLHIRKM
jgi:hypothetical protein